LDEECFTDQSIDEAELAEILSLKDEVLANSKATSEIQGEISNQ
jgi:hypothetical protein